MENVTFDYKFYRIPKRFFKEDMFRDMTNAAKVLYGILLDRKCLSDSNGDAWRDEYGITYIIYTKDVIKNWMRSKDTIEFLGLWEKLHNSNFKGVEFDSFRNQAGSNAFTMSPTKWIETTGAIGIVSKSGRYGGTFAHSDIAFEFAS